MTSQVIPDAAVEAAVIAYKHAAPYLSTRNALIEALEAAAPHIEKAAYERGWGAGFRHTSAALKFQAEQK